MPPTKRQHPGVQIRPGKGSGARDTRDARDDATIIAWLQRIDQDILKRAKEPAVDTGDPGDFETGPNAGGIAQTIRSSLRRLVEQGDQKERKTTETSKKEDKEIEKQADKIWKSLQNPLKAIKTAVNDAAKGIVTSILRTSRGNANVAVPAEGRVIKETFAQQVSDLATGRNVPPQQQVLQSPPQPGTKRDEERQKPHAKDMNVEEVVSKIRRETLTSLNAQGAEHTFSFRQLKQGIGAAPNAGRAAKVSSSTASTIMQGAMQRHAAVQAAPGAMAAGRMAGGVARAGAVGAGVATGTGGGIAGLAAAGAGLGAIGIAAGVAVAGVVALGVGMVVVTAGCYKFASGVHEANKGLAEFSGAMAGVMAQAEIRDIKREMALGNRVAPAAGQFEKAFGDFKDSLLPLRELGSKLGNMLGMYASRIGTFIMGFFNPIIEKLTKFIDWWMGNNNKDDDPIPLGPWLNAVAGRRGAEIANRPKPDFGRDFETSGADF